MIAAMLPRNGTSVQPSRPDTRATTARLLVRLLTGTFTAGSWLATGGLEVELDALGERQRVGMVDGVGLAAHVHLPGVGAGLATAAGFLLAAEGATDLGAGGADVHVGDAAIGAGRAEEL